MAHFVTFLSVEYDGIYRQIFELPTLNKQVGTLRCLVTWLGCRVGMAESATKISNVCHHQVALVPQYLLVYDLWCCHGEVFNPSMGIWLRDGRFAIMGKLSNAYLSFEVFNYVGLALWDSIDKFLNFCKYNFCPSPHEPALKSRERRKKEKKKERERSQKKRRISRLLTMGTHIQRVSIIS